MSVRYMLMIILLMKLEMKSIDFVVSYTKADAKTDILMETPTGFLVGGYHECHWIIKFKKKLYGMKEYGLTWFVHLNGGKDTIGLV